MVQKIKLNRFAGDLNNSGGVGWGGAPDIMLPCVVFHPPPSQYWRVQAEHAAQDLIYILYGPYRCRSCRHLIYVIITGFNLVSLTYRIKLFDDIYICTVEFQLSELQSSGSFSKLIFCLKCWLAKPTTYKSLYVHYCSVLWFRLTFISF